MDYKEPYVRDKLKDSEKWVVVALQILNKNSEFKPKDVTLFDAMITYFGKFNKLAPKHFELVRKRIPTYTPYLTDQCEALK